MPVRIPHPTSYYALHFSPPQNHPKLKHARSPTTQPLPPNPLRIPRQHTPLAILLVGHAHHPRPQMLIRLGLPPRAPEARQARPTPAPTPTPNRQRPRQLPRRHPPTCSVSATVYTRDAMHEWNVGTSVLRPTGSASGM